MCRAEGCVGLRARPVSSYGLIFGPNPRTLKARGETLGMFQHIVAGDVVSRRESCRVLGLGSHCGFLCVARRVLVGVPLSRQGTRHPTPDTLNPKP